MTCDILRKLMQGAWSQTEKPTHRCQLIGLDTIPRYHHAQEMKAEPELHTCKPVVHKAGRKAGTRSNSTNQCKLKHNLLWRHWNIAQGVATSDSTLLSVDTRSTLSLTGTAHICFFLLKLTIRAERIFFAIMRGNMMSCTHYSEMGDQWQYTERWNGRSCSSGVVFQ